MRAVLVGEAMLELSRDGAGWRMGYGGDTLNTAIHMARSGLDVAYLTALGADTLSRDLRAKWRDEGVDDALVLTHPTRIAGLYAIETDANGERSFTYWRGESAAREMFACPGLQPVLQSAAAADLLGFSLITLAVLPPRGRDRLLALAATVRARGGRVAFDSNYRPRLWPDLATARAARDAAAAVADIGLPTLEDEVALGLAPDAEAVAGHWRDLGCAEVVVKLGPRGCRLPDGALCAPDAVLTPVDTSGAGDAFNAGYLGARLRDLPPAAAATEGHAQAAWTIMHAGAIPPRR